jgi:hypothetical protein
MSQRPGHGRQKPKKSTLYAGPTTCLRCDRVFESWDRRQNRLCMICRETIDREPSGEDDYPLHAPWRRPRNRDEG